ncbi:unnamed protein product [Lampetra planeri]
MGCCSSAQSKREWKPLEQRSCTDILWLVLFSLFCIGMACICGFVVFTGASARLIYGYDSYGNTCGQNNTKIEGVPLSGRNMKDLKNVFFLDPCNIDFINMKVKSIALCVSKCPAAELTTYNDLRQFALDDGSALCTYDVSVTQYPHHSERFTKCPRLPVRPSKTVALLHRCIPVDISCYAEFAEAFINVVNDNSIVRRAVAGLMASKEIIMGLCVLALVLSLIMMVIIRYISRVLVWILTILVVIGTTGGTGVLWWLYMDHRDALNNKTTAAFGKAVTADNVQALFVYSVCSTIFTVILLLVMMILRKRVALTITLFHVAGKVFIHIPLLALQPFWTFLCLMLFWVYWIAVFLFLGSAGSPVKNSSTGLVEFHMEGLLQYMMWYHAVGLFWISEFILACQQMTIAGAVVTYYYTRDKSQMPMTPILSAVLRTLRYHLGTLAKGSFIITLVKIPRVVLMYIHSQLKGKKNAIALCLVKACICCLWCLEKCLAYLNQNAYTATAINSTSFCTSARDALVILVENALRVAAINTVGDFVLFLGKYNDGSPGQEYYMDKALMRQNNKIKEDSCEFEVLG